MDNAPSDSVLINCLIVNWYMCSILGPRSQHSGQVTPDHCSRRAWVMTVELRSIVWFNPDQGNPPLWPTSLAKNKLINKGIDTYQCPFNRRCFGSNTCTPPRIPLRLHTSCYTCTYVGHSCYFFLPLSSENFQWPSMSWISGYFLEPHGR